MLAGRLPELQDARSVLEQLALSAAQASPERGEQCRAALSPLLARASAEFPKPEPVEVELAGVVALVLAGLLGTPPGGGGR